MKTGILTFHCTDNVGSLLQAYALQQTVQAFDVECDIINYQRKNWLRSMYIPLLKKKLSHFWWLGYPALMLLIKAGYIKYDLFRREYLKIAPAQRISDHTVMQQVGETYDKLIVGSDQIWNLDNSKVDYTHFLDFTADNSKKVAYAASFGRRSIPEQHENTVSALIKNIHYLSVRESDGVDIVKHLTGRDAELVLDPTLIFNAGQWGDVAKKPREDDYILIYLRQDSDQINQIASRLHNQTGCPIISLQSWWHNSVGKSIFYPSPQEWIGYIMNAKYIVTNSFHGVAFSINFNKQFFAVQINHEGAEADTNSRIGSILDQFGLRERLVTAETQVDSMRAIDYSTVNALLNEKREKSLAFLGCALFGED